MGVLEAEAEHSGMGMARRKLGAVIAGIGLAVIAAGVFAGGASAQGDGQSPTRLQCPASSYAFAWSNVDDGAAAITGAGTTYSDGTFTVKLSNAAPTVGDSLDWWHVGSVKFDANAPVSAIEVQLWQPGATYIYPVLDYSPPATSGTITSPMGSLGAEGQAPIKGLVFCFQKVAPTTTSTSTTTTSTTTTAVMPEQVIVTTTTPPTTTAVPVEVLPQVETAPQQIAFTGSSSGPLVALGAVLVLLGLSMVSVDRLGLLRRYRHQR
jgi:hypothetical protein